MTIFRFSAGLLAIFAGACTDGWPPANTELGRIVRVSNFSDAAVQLRRFAEARLNNRPALRHEFAEAGFERSVYSDGPDKTRCERFELKTNDFFPCVYFVNICAGKVFANAGQQAP